MPIPRAIKRLDRADLFDILTSIEEIYATETGDDLSSEEFYATYRAGGFDTPFGMAWATYYEAFVRMSEARRPALESLLGQALPPVAAGCA